MPKLQYACRRYHLTVPEALVTLLDWKPGDEIKFKATKGKIYLEKKEKK